MKTSSKILFIITFLSLVGSILFIPDFISKLSILYSTGLIVTDVYFFLEIGLMLVFQISLFILFVKTINKLALAQKIFFATVPMTLSFATIIYTIVNINNIAVQPVRFVATALNISQNNNNNILWAVALGVIYIIFMFIVLWLSCRPLDKVSNAVERLGDGKVRTNIVIGGSKQFKDIEFGLNKINENYKKKENLIKQTNNEYQKFIPRQFLKYLGKSSILELELGNQVKKDVTTMFCDIRNSTATSTSLSLEENFRYINEHLKRIAPIVRRYGGFIDKYLGDGVLAVFSQAKDGIECASAIVKSIKNSSKEIATEIGISLHTGEVAIGIVGEEERKSPTIISDNVNFTAKMEQINKEFGSNIVFSKATLNALPSSYPLAYRYIGSLEVENHAETLPIFENVECYEKSKRNKIIASKQEFENAVRNFNQGKFNLAKVTFEKLYKNVKSDKVCYSYFNKSQNKKAT